MEAIHINITQIRHDRWLREGCDAFHRVIRLFWYGFILPQQRYLKITRHVLMRVTLEPRLLDSLRLAMDNLPPGTMIELYLDLRPTPTYHYCRTPPSDAALLAMATELVHIVSSMSSLRNLGLSCVNPFISSSILATCAQIPVEEIRLDHCPLVTANVRAMFSIKSLVQLEISDCRFENPDSIHGFCRGIEACSLKGLRLSNVTVGPEHQERLALVLAHCETLVRFRCSERASISPSFRDHYCTALSNNFDTKLSHLSWYRGEECELGLDGHLVHINSLVAGIDAVLVTKIRNWLTWNRQRMTCPPLFAAIGNAETDAARKQCLVEAFAAVGIPVVFEYITANQNNLIALIQRLGRSSESQNGD